MGPRGLDALTGQQRRIIALAAAGLSNQEIARRVCLSEQTVKNHMTDIYDRLEVRGRIEAARFVWQAERAD